MEGIALGVLAAASFGLLVTKKRKDGFLVSNESSALFGPGQTNYVESSAKKYNPLMALISPGNNPLLNPGYTPDELQNVQHKVRGAIGGIKANPANPSFNYKPSYTSDLQINPVSKGTAIDTMKICESVKTIDCSKFDDPNFRDNCGMCFEDGKNSSGSPSIGGLYVSEDDKDNAVYNAKRMGSKHVDYNPSIGTCKPKRFVTSKAECIRLQKQYECEKKQNFEVPGCSQCFQDGTFKYLDPDSVTKDTAVLVLAGNGAVSITKVTTQETVQVTLSSTPSNIGLSSLMEGDSIQLDFKTADSYVAGYISGTTASGTFNMDILPVTSTDLITNSKPRITGSLKVNEASYTVIRPGAGKKSMSLVLTNPFTFIAVNDDEAGLCPSSPYIATEQSAKLLQSSPCYAKGQRPGNYSKECIQSIFDSAGCNSQGTAYPNNDKNLKAVSYDQNGNPLTIGGIANIVYGMYNTATTGQDANGQPLSINDWDKASMACLGTNKTSVCDKYDKINGPLGVDCLSYLWQNSGASDKIPFGIGPTYTGGTNSASLQARRGNRFCTTGGSMAPIDDKGTVNQGAVQLAQTKGGVAGVTQFYDQISKKANDNTLADEVRKPFIQQCYGVELNANKAQVGVDSGVNTGSQTIYSTWTGKSTDYGTVNVPKDYTISLVINPKGPVSSWSSIIHFSSTGGDMNGFGSRMPAMFFGPGTTELHIPIGDINDANFYLSPPVALPLNQDSTVSIATIGNKITITINGKQFNYTQKTPGGRPSGPARLFSPSPWYIPINGTVKNLTIGGSSYQSVIDYTPGRTKSAFVLQQASKGLVSRYNDRYYANILRVTRSASSITVDVEAHGDASMGPLQQPSSSLVFVGDRMEKVRAIKQENVAYAPTLASARLTFDVPASATKVQFSYGEAGYSLVDITN